MRAFLFPGENADPLDTDDQAVEINQEDDDDPDENTAEDQAETVEIAAPDNGNRFGFFNRVAVIDVASSEGTEDIEVFYTVSAPGTPPEWTACGSETKAQSSDGIRCELADDADEPSEVNGVAAVPSDTVPMFIDPNLPPVGDEEDPDSGDAHRVIGYVQIPSGVTITPPSRSNQPLGSCTDNFVLLVTDQEGRKVAGVDVDVHAQGPDDDLSFDTSNQTDPNKPPDQGHTSPTESGRNCATNQFGGTQGEHDRPTPNVDDVKHIERSNTTSDSGTFRFRLWSPASGPTQITGWADNTPDDRFCTGEPAGAASIGWAQAAPAPVAESPESCQTGTATGTATSTATGTATGTATSTATGTATGTATSTSTSTATATTSPTGTSTTTTSPTSTTTTSPTSTSTTPPVGQAASLELSPNEDSSKPGTERTYVARVRDAQGNPVPGVDIDWTSRGVGRFVSTEDTTDELGEARAVVTSNEPGEQGITASASCGADLCSDSSSQRWGPSRCTILGTNRDDVLRGTSVRDVICGFDGDDELRGLRGGDTVIGSDGRDLLVGSGGSDFLSGGSGNDRLKGGSDRDSLRGAKGRDLLDGGSQRDDCFGGPGKDRYRRCEQRR